MGRSRAGVAVLLALLFAIAPASTALAGESVVTATDLERAAVARDDAEAQARGAILKLLGREEVKALAQRTGLDLRRAQSAVATLEGEELRGLAEQASAADATLAGGQTIQISLVAALLIVIIIILLVD